MTDPDALAGALHDRHVALEASMAEEAGWQVPLAYRGPIEEAAEVRRRAGVFDLSHFGRLRIRGDGAIDLLERACTADVAGQEDDTSQPVLLLNERGGIIDLVRLVRLESFWVVVTSPLCRQKVLDHLNRLAETEGHRARIDDQTGGTTLLAVNGPAAPGILDAVLPFTASDLPSGTARMGSLLIARYLAERVSFSGEWGLEVAVPNLAAGAAWRFITDKAGDKALPPCGVAAWDVLRIEAGQCRYGHEINETVDPFTAGLEGLLHFDHDFVGRSAAQAQAARPPARRIVGLKLVQGADIPRQGNAVCDGDEAELGAITSGTFSPALDRPIALASVSAEAGQALFVGPQRTPAELCPLPFLPPARGR